MAMNLELAALHSVAPLATPASERPAPGIPPSGKSNGSASERGTGEASDAIRELGEAASAEEVIRWAHRRFGRQLALSSSFGADSAVMLHLASSIVPGIKVIFIDTGYLFPETYRFAEELERRFNIDLQVYAPKITPARQEALYGELWEQGEEGVRRYLAINKVEPMQRALQELGIKAWMAGLRATQTEHRRQLTKVGLQDGRVKLHPILDWDRAQIDAYLKTHDLPRHPLYEKGYRSIGDIHSTIPVGSGEDERAGRFLGQKKECGLHLSAEQNTSLSSSKL